MLKLKQEFLRKNPQNKISYFGLKDSLEEKLCNKEDNLTFFTLNLDRQGLKVSNLKNYYKEYKRVKVKLKELKADVVISSGGFVSIPVLMAARKLKIKYFLLEENTVVGDCNKLFGKKATKVFLSFPLPKMKKNMIVCGNPASSLDINKYEYTMDKKYINILILGGSLGSKSLCDLALELSKVLDKKYRIILVCGKYYMNIYNEANSNFIIYEYIDRLYNMIYNADIVISRAGSATLCEILSINKPLIVAPSLNTKANHQVKNAEYLQNNKACVMIDESKIKPLELVKIISKMSTEEEYIKDMKNNQKSLSNPQCAEYIVNEVEK